MYATQEVVRERVEKTSQVLKYADSMRETGLFTDVCVKYGSKSFRAHRLILSSYSIYFRTMFQTEMQEKYADTVEIYDVNETSMESLIDFIYTGNICINEENVFDLMAASDYLQIDQTKTLCYNFLLGLISVETCFQILEVVYLYPNIILLNTTFQFIKNNFALILTSNNFLYLTKQNFVNIFTKLNSGRIEERLVYDAIMEWVKHKDSRKDDFPELFQCLDLCKLSSTFLAETVSNEPLVLENPVCSNLVMKALTAKLQEQASSISSIILSLGGLYTLNKVFAVYNDDLTVYPALPQSTYGHCSLKLDNFVYFIGGRVNFPTTNKVWRMKIYVANMKWEELASMRDDRCGFGAAVYKNGFAVAGGWALKRESGKSAEFYNPSLDQWSTLQSMNESRMGNALVACNDRLFCVGGRGNDCKYSSSVEMLSDENATWKYVQPMQRPRWGCAAVNFMGNIYAIGGANIKEFSTKSVEKYDPVSDQWVYVKEMNIERHGHSACVLQDKIFVVGGKNENDRIVFEIECYDPSSDDWSIVGNANEKLLNNFLVAI